MNYKTKQMDTKNPYCAMIWEACDRAVVMANEAPGFVVEFVFNKLKVIANPGDTASAVETKYHESIAALATAEDRTQSRVPLPLCEVLDIIRTGYIETDDLMWARELINDAVTARVQMDIQAWIDKEKAAGQ